MTTRIVPSRVVPVPGRPGMLRVHYAEVPEPPRHGDLSRWNSGCRCELCRVAYRFSLRTPAPPRNEPRVNRPGVRVEWAGEIGREVS